MTAPIRPDHSWLVVAACFLTASLAVQAIAHVGLFA